VKVDKLWLDGKIVDGATATVSVLCHSLHYGSGVFEGIRCYETDKGGAVFRLKEHIDRLYYSADVLGLKIPYSKEEFRAACKLAVTENGLVSAYIRPLVFYGADTLGVPPRKCPTVCMIASWKWGAYVHSDAPRIQTSKYCRVHPRSVDCKAKVSGHYVNSLMAVRDAHNAGFDEALLLDHEGYVAECSGENIFVIRDGKVFTPALGNILPGITRSTIMELLGDMGYEVEEKKFLPKFLAEADEAFMVGTAAEVTPICGLDEHVITEKPGDLTLKVQAAYLDVVHGRNEKYIKYCDFLDS
jgi:branched-chain amino acid aminotransferase